MQCLKSEPWLTLKLEDDGQAKTDDYRMRGMVDVFVEKPQIRISVAYMAIGETDLKKIGNPAAADTKGAGVLNVGGAFQTLQNLLHGGGNHGNVASLNANLGVAARFFKNNGISRISDTGYTVMESWGKDGAKFKSGGTMFVRTTVANNGGAAMIVGSDLREIPYGFQLDTKGGLIDCEQLDLAVKFTKSTVAQTANDDYDRKEDISEQKLVLPIGRTTFLGGVKMLDDDRISPSGLPFLRNTPMLNWFVADSGTEISDRRLVIMVCPEIIDNTQSGNLKATEEINLPVVTEGAKTTEQREEEKKPFSGFWYWLNWFTF